MRKSLIFFIFVFQYAFSFAIDATTEVVLAPTAQSQAELSEDQIPLNIQNLNQKNTQQSDKTKLMMTLVVITALLGVSYFMIKRFSFKNKISNSNKEIKILSQHYLGPKKSLAIIRVAGESILVGITDQNINMIKSLSLLDEDMPQMTTQNFNEVMSENEDSLQTAESIEDDFSFSGLKTTVSQKLKTMRNIQ